MTEVDYSTIEHLDFEVTENPQQPCQGFKITLESQVVEDNKTCPNKPILMAVRSCCGMISILCRSCYNRICLFNAECRAKSKVHSHSESGTTHVVEGQPFSQVQFL